MTDSNNKGKNTGDHPFKRSKVSNFQPSSKVIGTHSGTFQADEALGVWLVRQLPDYYQARVVRSRDREVLAPLDMVIDVGGVYDHEARRYDHHQRGYDERFQDDAKGRCSKLSASGLVYRHYGREVLRTLYPALSPDQLETAYVKMYDALVECTDAIDTGVEMVPGGLSPVYTDHTGLSSRVARLNPRWNEVDVHTGSRPDDDERFAVASALCGHEFLAILTTVVESQLPAREFVREAVMKRHDTHPSGEILVFASGGLPWRKHLYELERELLLTTKQDEPLVKFVLYTDTAGMWRVQAVTVEGQAFENRLSLPEEWRGVRDEDLTAIAGIPGCTFCHAAGFIGGNVTYQGALAMADAALRRKKEEDTSKTT